jgi:peptidoglycan/LPS O-acetylase OafA/YrhL
MSVRFPPRDQTDDLGLLDLLRWISACAVAVGHVRDLLFVPFPAVERSNLSIKAFYALTGFGHEAVIVFFVLSGFLVGGGLVRDGLGAAPLVDYFIHRFSRIYIVLLPALLATLVLDLGGAQILPIIYHQAGWSSSLDFAAASNDSLAVLACNAANLQDSYCPAFGSNAPLWSLAYEWFYYLTFPIVLAAIGLIRGRASTFAPLLLYLPIMLLLAYFFPSYVAYYPVWLFGVAARGMHARPSASPRRALAGGVLTFILLAISRTHLVSSFFIDVSLGLSLAISLASIRLSTAASMFSRINAGFASFSYSLYVMHFPLMVFVVATLVRVGAITARLAPTPTAFALFVACCCLIYGTAWVFSLGTERQTRRVRSLLSGILRFPDPAREPALTAARMDYRDPVPRGSAGDRA